jgi:hypothetical protein
MDLTRRPASGVTPAAPKLASALHTRSTPAHVIDLRQAAPVVQHAPYHVPAAPPQATTQERHLARFSDRFDRAKRFNRSDKISRFGSNTERHYDQFGNPTLDTLKHPVESTSAATSPDHHQPITPGPKAAEMPHLAATQHNAMAHLSHIAPATAPAWQPHLNVSSGPSRVMTAFAAFALMAGYIWLQNYPKLALQSANNRAGLAASLPGYIPSSYNLAHTDTSPGLVTLNFTSPSATQNLTIAQHRTTWDSSSLLDNFVAKQADDYATFQGQGLTIYLYGPNKATWVNHGIWYSIEGAARLSREQILKIAYSL